MTHSDAPPAWSAGQPITGWLRLTARGAWLIRDSAVEHPALRAHLNRHYFRDAAGRYCVQNGQQVVYVRLDYAPYALHVTPDGALEAHTGEPAGAVQAACLDEAGALTLLNALGAGRVDEASLAYFADRVVRCRRPVGRRGDARRRHGWQRRAGVVPRSAGRPGADRALPGRAVAGALRLRARSRSGLRKCLKIPSLEFLSSPPRGSCPRGAP